MRKPRLFLLAILFLTLAAAFIDFPEKLPFKISVGKFKLEQTLSRPPLNFTLGPLRIARDTSIREGLDLAGGTHIVFRADMENIGSGDRDRALESAREVIERRVNFYGVSEPVVQTSKTSGDYRILVELPGITNVDEAIDLIGKTAQLSFREEEATPSAEATASAYLFGPFTKKTDLTGKDLRRSNVEFDPNTGEPQVSLEFNSDGAKLFEEITKRNVGKQVAIFLDDQLVSAPRVNEVIAGGNAVITGDFTVDEAKRLSIQLNAGALPAPLEIIEQRNIGATLGQASVKKSILAGLIGLGIVAAFMLANYGWLGFFADLALLIYTLLVLALFKLIPVTLTLAGIAGFILSIGMAVDANILIFERTREELRAGKSLALAVEEGFSRAWLSIRDSNVSSLITSLILFALGTQSVKGFALTLGLGIILSMFSAITVTRTFLRALEFREGRKIRILYGAR